MALSSEASNLPPQPLKRKSSSSGPSVVARVRKAWSRAQVSLVLQVLYIMCAVARLGSCSSIRRFTASVSGATMSSVSRVAIS